MRRALFLLLAACGQAPATQPPPDLAQPPDLAALPDLAPRPAEKFVGTWMFTAGSWTMACGGPPGIGPLEGNMRLAAGLDSDLVWIPVERGCAVRFSASGATASALPGPPCVQTARDCKYSYSITMATLTTADGMNLTHKLDATNTIECSRQTTLCSITESGTLIKVAR